MNQTNKNQQSLLQYLSTASDSFLVVALAAVLALPVMVSLAAQPVLDKETQDITQQAQTRTQIAQNNIARNNATASNVLGVSTTVAPTTIITTTTVVPAENKLDKTSVKIVTNDARKIAILTQSTTKSEYKVSEQIKAAGTYTLFEIKNDAQTSVYADFDFEFGGTVKSYVVTVGDQKFTFTKDAASVKYVVIPAQTTTKVSITADSKQLGKFGLTAKLS